MYLNIQGILYTYVRLLYLMLIVLHAVLNSIMTQYLEVWLSVVPDSPLLLLLLPVRFLFICV